MTDTGEDQLQAIAKTAESARKEAYDTRLLVVEMRAELAACIKEVARLAKLLDSGSGVETRVVLVDAKVEQTAKDLAACQARCRFRVRLAVGIISGMLTPLVVWGMIKAASHIFGS